MNGEEHYQKAEIMLDLGKKHDESAKEQQLYFAAAQVHATLALVAATLRSGDSYAWTAS